MLRRAWEGGNTQALSRGCQGPDQDLRARHLRAREAGMAGGRGLPGQFEMKWTQRPNTNSLLLKSSAILQNVFARESLITGRAHF